MPATARCSVSSSPACARGAGGAPTRAAPGRVPYRVALRSPVAVDHLELVYNGKVVKTFRLSGERHSLDAEGELALPRGGWLLLRAWNDHADPLVLDLYPYATTSPIYLERPGAPQGAAEDAAYFVAWMDRAIATTADNADFNNDQECGATLDYLEQARARFLALEETAGVTRP